jgi:hypothetical protein
MNKFFHLLDKLQYCAMGRNDVSGIKFLLFIKTHHVRSVACLVTQFVQLCSKVFVFFRDILPEHTQYVKLCSKVFVFFREL